MSSIINFFIEYLKRLNTGLRAPSGTTGEALVPDQSKERYSVNILLFIATLVSTTFVGATDTGSIAAALISGLPYSITLMAILLVHEFGHYFAARSFGVRSTLPYFIPFPSLVGTMGAVIKTKSPIPHRRALFYIGIMGPMPGFILSLAAVFVGIYLSDVRPFHAGSEGGFILGSSFLVAMIIKLIHGSIPAGYHIFLSPYARAGWFGFLITSLNLMPIGQLDGSHILYALVGKKQLVFGWAFFAILIALSFIWEGWIVWIIMTLAFLMVGHPEIPDGRRLSDVEKMLGWICMVILLLTFVPIPIEFL
jgi:membrane-associated protease RseP (regulator of RpoE activity)